MSAHAMYYFPRLHKEFLEETPPIPLDFFAPCLEPSPAHIKEALSPIQQSFTKALPLSPKEARAALSETIQTGAYQWQTGILHSLAVATQKQHTEKKAKFDESMALAKFTQTNEAVNSNAVFHSKNSIASGLPNAACSVSSSDESLQKARVSGHILLLLVLNLEKNVIESQNIAKKYTHSQNSLHSLLNEGENSQEATHAKGNLENDGLSELVPSVSCPWQTILYALALFLPEGTLLYTDDCAVLKGLKQCCAPHEFFELKGGGFDSLLAATASVGNIAGSFSEPGFSSSALFNQKITIAFPRQLLSCEVSQ